MYTDFKNEQAFIVWYEALSAIARSSIVWKGLPDTINVIWLEQKLFDYGSVMIPDLDGLKFACQYEPISWDIYNEPVRKKALVPRRYIDKVFDNSNSVIIYNNIHHCSSQLETMMYAQKLYETERTTQVNINAQKTPVLLLGDFQQAQTLKTIYAQYVGNNPVIFGDKNNGIDKDIFKVVNTQAPFISDKLHSLQNEILSDFLKQRGVQDISDKKERLITSEVDIKQTVKNVFANRFLLPRQQACDRMNMLWGLNCSVSMIGGEENGDVHADINDNIDEPSGRNINDESE